MSKLVDWWLNYKPLSKEETEIVNRTRDDSVYLTTSYQHQLVCNEFFKRIPWSGVSLNTHDIGFLPSGTDFIKQLFDYYVNDDTLIVSTFSEHENVIKEISSRSNKKIMIDYFQGKFFLKENIILQEAKKHKNVFVYIIGTQISSGEIIPQLVLEKLHNLLKSNGISFVMILDDVHGMFITPRDYSIFDYVLYTAHALVPYYNMGLLINKKDKHYFGNWNYNWGMQYLEALDVLLSRKDKLYDFYKVIANELRVYLNCDKFNLISYNTPNIFSLQFKDLIFTKKMYDTLNQNGIRIEATGEKDAKNYIRLRAQTFICKQNLLKPGLKLLKNILDTLLNRDE